MDNFRKFFDLTDEEFNKVICAAHFIMNDGDGGKLHYLTSNIVEILNNDGNYYYLDIFMADGFRFCWLEFDFDERVWKMC